MTQTPPVPVDWLVAVDAATDTALQVHRLLTLDGAPTEIAGPMAAYAALASFHGPTGSPSGAVVCKTCGRHQPYPCPPLQVALRFDPTLRPVVDAALQAGPRR